MTSLQTKNTLKNIHKQILLTGESDSIFESTPKIESKGEDFDETLQKASAGQYLQMYGESSVKVKVWQIFMFNKQTGTPDFK